jgi:hypothetical protein
MPGIGQKHFREFRDQPSPADSAPAQPLTLDKSATFRIPVLAFLFLRENAIVDRNKV